MSASHDGNKKLDSKFAHVIHWNKQEFSLHAHAHIFGHNIIIIIIIMYVACIDFFNTANNPAW
jgi:hypothetical protein